MTVHSSSRACRAAYVRPVLQRRANRSLRRREAGRPPAWAFAALATLLLFGCGEKSEPSPKLAASLVPNSISFVGRPCIEGSVEACTLTLGEHAGQLSCYEGKRTCRDGRFGACEGGMHFALPAPKQSTASGLRPLAFSDPIDCTDNPCNRHCREFIEAPGVGLVADQDLSATPLSPWHTGHLVDYPPEVVVLGTLEPCQLGEDCQFNTVCEDPAVGSCTHSTCVTGETLVSGCNRCADEVCAANPDCCAAPVSCTHDPCDASTGTPLDPACDSCVAAICAEDDSCCTTAWTQSCVDLIATTCAPLGQSCGCPDGSSPEPNGACYQQSDAARDWGLARDACNLNGGGWSLAQIDDAEENEVVRGLLASGGLGSAWLGGRATSTDNWSWQGTGTPFFVNDASGGSLQPGFDYENWGPGQPALGLSGHGILMTTDGAWGSDQSFNAHDYVCEGPPNVLEPRQPSSSWDATCVDLAESECGVSCPAADRPALGLGACTPREASRLDANCPNFDLSLGATCDDAGTPQVPVCNHGQTTAPAGLRLTHLPPGSIGSGAPDLSLAEDCPLTEAIAPGRCVVVTGCPALVAGRELIVNPIDGSENAGECRLDDNWTIYEPATCREAICEASAHDAGRVATSDCSLALDNPLSIDTALTRAAMDTAALEPHCGPDEILWGNSCYLFSSDVRTWNGAFNRCRNRGPGWDLVALNSEAENTWVRDMTDTSTDVHIGFNDKGNEGNHVWSNGTCQAWINWDQSSFQPNNNPPGSQQCSRMTNLSDYQWEDKECQSGVYPFVCEGPVLDARGPCATGQVQGPDGSCYALDESGSSHADARSACQALGSGWDLARIDDESTNDFVTALLECTPAWLSNPPGNYSNWAPAESIDLSQNPFIDELGYWHTTLDATPRATLCQGPQSPLGTSLLTQVSGSASCASNNEYYVEGPASAPEALVLCPDTCAEAAVAGQRLDVQIPCAPPPLPSLPTVIDGLFYAADCEGGGTIWDFFYYDSVTPADSSIAFEIRTAPSLAELGAATFVPIATAHAVPEDTQRCELSPPDCPIDIFEALGEPEHQYPALELRVTLTPGSNGEGPLLRDWKVRFSCPPSQ